MSETGKPVVSVIVPARDAEATLGRTLAALAAQRLEEPFEVIVVDAGSRDRTAAIAAEAGARVIDAGPLGPAEARNRGAAEARADALAFTDSDCFPEPGWLAGGLRGLEGSALVQGLVRPEQGVPMGPFDRSVSVGGEAGLYETANLFVRRDVFKEVGGFEEWLRPSIGPPHMAEDLHFGWKVRRSGGHDASAPTPLCTTRCSRAVPASTSPSTGADATFPTSRVRFRSCGVSCSSPTCSSPARPLPSTWRWWRSLAGGGAAVPAPARGDGALLPTLARGRGPPGGARAGGGRCGRLWSLLVGSARRRTPCSDG